MKRIIFLFVFMAVSAQAETLRIDIPDGWRVVVEDSVISLDDWAMQAIESKYESCADRIMRKEVSVSIEQIETLPAGRDAIIQKYLNRPGYENRKEKENN